MKRFFKKVRKFTYDMLYKRDCIWILIIAVGPMFIITLILEGKGIKLLRQESLPLLLVGPIFLALLNFIAKLYLAIENAKEQGISVKEAWKKL